VKEHQLIAGCQAGDKDAFKHLVQSYSSMMMGVGIRYLGNKDEAQDAMQEAFIRVFKSIQNLRADGHLGGWIRKITVNECLKLLKKRVSLTDIEKAIDLPIYIDPNVSQSLAVEEILKELNKIPEHYKIIFNLYEIEGYSHKEISVMLDIGESTSRTKLMRAKQMVQDLFNDRDHVLAQKII
jgi:RNA polymerase sigma-70 factor (ECF subfamily)